MSSFIHHPPRCRNASGRFSWLPLAEGCDVMTLDRWVPFRNESAGVRCRIFIFPHAGGNAAFYRPLRRMVPSEMDLCPIELPGRAARLEEAPITLMGALMDKISRVLLPLMDVPFGIFGHSVGAWTAFEAARRLRSADGQTARHLFVSGQGSPSRVCTNPPSSRARSRGELLAILHRLGGTPAAVMQRQELIAALLPALQADLALADQYAVDPADRLACPITAFGGADDVSRSGPLESWGGHTRGKFRTCIFPGGHFYFSPAAEALVTEIVHDLRTSSSLI
jgi:medium-chain acyl-[acyl-carrier-protein] hydrolase